MVIADRRCICMRTAAGTDSLADRAEACNAPEGMIPTIYSHFGEASSAGNITIQGAEGLLMSRKDAQEVYILLS